MERDAAVLLVKNKLPDIEYTELDAKIDEVIDDHLVESGEDGKFFFGNKNLIEESITLTKKRPDSTRSGRSNRSSRNRAMSPTSRVKSPDEGQWGEYIHEQFLVMKQQFKGLVKDFS